MHDHLPSIYLVGEERMSGHTANSTNWFWFIYVLARAPVHSLGYQMFR